MDSEKFAIMLLTIFGALVLGGLMAVGIAWHDKSTFVFALASSIAAWAASIPVMFDRPRIYGVLFIVCVLLAAASVVSFVS